MKKKENQEKKKSNIKIYEGIFVVVVLGILAFILFTKDNNNLEKYCVKAVCNDDKSMCFVYDTENDNTNIIWKGDCSKLK